MKKILFVLILLLICIFSFNVFAEETGKLIVKSGDGTKLGDEACLGDQCFYVIENDGETAKLLSKYNLYNGWVYNKEVVYQETTISSESNEKCYNLNNGDGCWNDFFEQTGLSEDADFYVSRRQTETDEEGKTYFDIYYFTYLDTKEFKQSSEAIGAHGGYKGEPELPEVAVFNVYNSNIEWFNTYYIENGLDDEEGEYVRDGDKYLDTFQDFNFKEDIIYSNRNTDNKYKVLASYEDYLDSQGLIIKDINILSLTDLNKIVVSAAGENTPLEEWLQEPVHIDGVNGKDGYYLYGNLKDVMDNEYEWLWATTYWLRTYANGTSFLFVDTLGDVCSSGDCGIVGAGIRPVIVVDSKDIVKPKEDIIVNPETGGVIAITILGLLGIGLFSFKLNKRNN